MNDKLKEAIEVLKKWQNLYDGCKYGKAGIRSADLSSRDKVN